MKLIKLSSIAGISAITSSNLHYLLSSIDSLSLKILGYGSLYIVGIMGVILDDSFTQYFEIKDNSIIAIIATILTFIFLGGSYRAFTLKENLEGLALAFSIAFFWVLLLFIYIKLMIGSTEVKKQW